MYNMGSAWKLLVQKKFALTRLQLSQLSFLSFFLSFFFLTFSLYVTLPFFLNFFLYASLVFLLSPCNSFSIFSLSFLFLCLSLLFEVFATCLSVCFYAEYLSFFLFSILSLSLAHKHSHMFTHFLLYAWLLQLCYVPSWKPVHLCLFCWI